MLLLVGASNVYWKDMAYVYVCIGLITLSLAFICVNNGMAADFIYTIDKGGRHSYGIVYPTDFAAHCLFIMMAYVYLRNEKLKFFEISIMFVVSVVVYKKTYARNDFVCMLLLCLLLLIVLILRKFNYNICDFRILRVIAFLFTFLSVFCTLFIILYNNDSAFFVKLNSVLSNRLSLSYRAMDEYGITLFGTFIQENSTILGYYFFVDCSYIRIAIKYGCVFFSFLGCIFYGIIHNLIELKEDLLIVVFIVIAVTGVVEHHIIEIAYGAFFWFIIYAKIALDAKD